MACISARMDRWSNPRGRAAAGLTQGAASVQHHAVTGVWPNRADAPQNAVDAGAALFMKQEELLSGHLPLRRLEAATLDLGIGKVIRLVARSIDDHSRGACAYAVRVVPFHLRVSPTVLEPCKS